MNVFSFEGNVSTLAGDVSSFWRCALVGDGARTEGEIPPSASSGQASTGSGQAPSAGSGQVLRGRRDVVGGWWRVAGDEGGCWAGWGRGGGPGPGMAGDGNDVNASDAVNACVAGLQARLEGGDVVTVGPAGMDEGWPGDVAKGAVVGSDGALARGWESNGARPLGPVSSARYTPRVVRVRVPRFLMLLSRPHSQSGAAQHRRSCWQDLCASAYGHQSA